MKFIADRSLGKLAKWMRILGYDTLFYSHDSDRIFLKRAQSEGRVVLTRKRDMGRRQFMGRMLVLNADHAGEQLRDVIGKLSLKPDPKKLFSRCIRCNEELVPLPKERVKGRVPPYTFDTQETFMTCPACGSIFWPGTHRDRASAFFRTHNQKDLP